ncbi:MAG TPA: hypothetical protein VIK72_06365 [Clostridiaceae bacterium]
MLYPKNVEKSLSIELFKNPTSEYRGAPFWAWNCKLEKEVLEKQIDDLKLMGMGGGHIHCRTGMATEYLGKEFMELVKSCKNKFKKEDMLCYLYDEDRWPSGFAGGIVTKEDKYKQRFLLFTTNEYNGDLNKASLEYDSSARYQRGDKRSLIASYQVVIEAGTLSYYKRLMPGEAVKGKGKLWRAYLEISGNSPWFNNQSYVNTLDKKAIDRFIQVTHEKYYSELKDDFGFTIPSIFTDEPQFTHKEFLGYATEEKDIAIPYTDDFEESYKLAYGSSFLDSLPELFWELPKGSAPLNRYRYHDHLCERFTTAFSDNIGNWCMEHGIMLTGHMMSEESLASQTGALGEAMRAYRSFQLPGIDMLCDKREFTTLKQAQSASNQYGRPGVLCEIYGVTNWDFDFRGHKLAGDWQAALGVTLRVHHLTWVSMGGEAKRDYPACIGYQSPWYREYPLIENYFSRLNTALTRGKNIVKIGVIHPVESYWLHFGPLEQTSIIREELETNFQDLTQWLLYGLLDFHFISEALLPSQNQLEESASFIVGEMNYDVILVPGNETLRSSTLDRLEAFGKSGGKVIFLGTPGSLVDAMPSDRIKKLSSSCTNIAFSKSKLLEGLEPYRLVDIRKVDGSRVDNIFYQLRSDNENRWLFICHVNKAANPDISEKEDIKISLKGNWEPTIYDSITGDIKQCLSFLEEGNTIINYEFYQHDSLLLSLEPNVKNIPKENLIITPSVLRHQEVVFKSRVPITLSEPNVLLLDMAKYSMDGEIFHEVEEILRIDNIYRKIFAYPLRMDALAQPWVDKSSESYEHELSLLFEIDSEIEVEKPYLALENYDNTKIIFNGKEISKVYEGYFVDTCIKKILLPPLATGRTEIILKIPYNSKTDVEWCYLLGAFGVKVSGETKKIIQEVKTLDFGDWVNQGLPFYAGNVTYHLDTTVEKGQLEIEIPHYRNPVLSVSLDAIKVGNIALAPYKLSFDVTKGKHLIDITAFGNRINAFGTVHNCDYTTSWYGPNAWRTTGNSWSYEYQLKPTGILVKPKIKVK